MKRDNKTQPSQISLISDLLRGKSISDDEIRNLNDWYDAEHKPKIEVYHELTKPEIGALMQKKIHQQIAKERDTQSRRNFYLAAAVLIPLIVFGFLFYILPPFQKHQNNTTNQAWVTVQSLPGERKTLDLPDGSKVTLNSNSAITYAENFLDNRAVQLDGEGFFEVVPQKGQPFTVSSGDLETKVLGTSFNVSSLRDAEGTIAVKTGKVSVKSMKTGTKVILQKGQLVNQLSGDLYAREITAEESIFDWVDGNLVMVNLELNQVVEKLSDWYGIEIQSAKVLPPCRITGTYKNLKIEEVLEIINYSINLKYSWHGKKLIIEEANC
ncbi:FecR family protein [Pararhodonellum marinum]|uniref:FecR family protein n=1 Tax=Pararhodonellum marinum TaxID=2755358 RepID=UPI00189086F6|nr:FecR domain-containing protein [Pararhodonellum marinum]